MTTGATGQLGLALPVQGELSGTWGDTVNNGLTQYINIAIAGTLTLTNDGAVTLANTTGDASASNVTSTLTGAGTVTAQFAIVRVTGTLTTAKVVTAPSYSKTYTVVNAATGGIVTFKASGQTGVSIAVGESAFVYFNGTDYVKVSGTASVTSFSAGTTGLTPSTSTTGAVTLAGTLAIANGGTGQTTANTALNALLPSQTGNANKYLQTDGTNSSWDAVSLSTADITGTLGTANGGTGLTSFTSGGVVYASSTSALATGSALTFDGTNFGIGGASAGAALSVKKAKATVQIESTTGTNSAYQNFSNTGTNFYVGIDNSTGSEFGTGAANAGLLWQGANSPIVFAVSNTEQMRLTSTSLYTASGINVGIGTSSPLDKLDVVSANTTYRNRIRNSGVYEATLLFQNSSTGTGGTDGLFLGILGSMDAYLWNYENNPIIFGTNNTQRMVLDSAGNLGLGVTPSSFNASNLKAFQVKTGSVSSNGGSSYFSSNVNKTSGGNFYIDTGAYASAIEMNNAGGGGMQFMIAPFGTAGNAISFTQAMTLDASGNLLVGTTSSVETNLGARLGADGYVRSTRAATVNTASTLDVYSTGAGAFRFYVGMGGTVFATSTTISAISDQRLKENVQDLDAGLDAVMSLKPRKFDWKAGKGKDIKGDRGWIAQEFEQVFPDMIDTWKDEAPEGEEPYKSVRADLMPVLVKAIQEQQAIIESLKARLDAANL